MNGILILDKPKGMTSSDLVLKAKRIIGAKKAGHTGTLDPIATGVMLILIGKATKLARFFGEDKKRYLAEVRFGIETDTLDGEGKVISKRSCEVSSDNVEKTLKRFRGHIEQRAPIYSAIKKKGRPLYDLARKGEAVSAPTRNVEIIELKLVDFKEGENPAAKLDVTASKGTYIRSLASDIGKALGVGAHLSALTRLEAGRYSLDDSISLETLTQAPDPKEFLISIEKALSFMGSIKIQDEETEKKLLSGNQVVSKGTWTNPLGEDILLIGREGQPIVVARVTLDEDERKVVKPYIVLGETD